MEKLFIIGSSGHAKVIMDIILKENKYEIIGLLDDFKKVGEEVLNYKILGKIKDLDKLAKAHNTKNIVVGVGDNFCRYKIVRKLKNYSFITTIHPSAQIGFNVKIGAGTVIISGAIINSCSKIGNHCILNTKSSLDHDCIMDDFSSLAPGVTVGGNVKIGKLSALCLGANVINKIQIGENAIIGSGSCVLNDIEKNTLAYGIPCKVVRKRKINEKYL